MNGPSRVSKVRPAHPDVKIGGDAAVVYLVPDRIPIKLNSALRCREDLLPFERAIQISKIAAAVVAIEYPDLGYPAFCGSL